MKNMRKYGWLTVCSLVLAPAATWAESPRTESLPASETLMKAMVDEITRSMNLQMEDLEKPYFIQYAVDDVIIYNIASSYGAITTSNRDRSRDFFGVTRVGDPELDNTNFSEGGNPFFGGGNRAGVQARLPIEDDYTAIRQAIWWAVDDDYKEAVETLTKKRAYLKDRTIEDRPNDFTQASVVTHMEPPVSLTFDRAEWENHLKSITGHFKKHPQIQDSSARLLAAVGNGYLVNSEGTRIRVSDSRVFLLINAELQADDGMTIAHKLSYLGNQTGDLPPVKQILEDIDHMVEKLDQAAKAPDLESYTGPVLFDGLAAAQMFRSILSEGLAGQPDEVGTQRRSDSDSNLETHIGKRILPSSFRVYDDPIQEKAAGRMLMGHYRYDDEGVLAETVTLVEEGKLKGMVMGRTPTKKQSGSNGHARRSPGSAMPQAYIGNLFIVDEEGVSEDNLKKELIERAQDEGLEYGIRVAAIQLPEFGSSQSQIMSYIMGAMQGTKSLGDPVFCYKVFPDGREEMIRGIEFGGVKLRDLRNILLAGNSPTVYNYIGVGMGGASPAASIISPPVLFEELEIKKLVQEHEKKPILPAPLSR